MSTVLINGTAAASPTVAARPARSAAGPEDSWAEVIITIADCATDEEVAIPLATYAPLLASSGYATLRVFESRCNSTAVSHAPVLGRVTNPAGGSLEPYIFEGDSALITSAGSADLPRVFRIPTNATLYYRPRVNTGGPGSSVRLELAFSRFVVP